MWRPSGAHIRKSHCVGEEKLTKASVGIVVYERRVTGYYRGTITTRNRIGDIFRIVWVATAGTTPGLIAAIIRLSVVAAALVSEGYREGDCESNRHKSTDGNGQECGTAIDGSGLGYRLRRGSFRVSVHWKIRRRLAWGRCLLVFCTTSRTVHM